MPALNEADLIKILGPDYREQQEAAIRATGVKDNERATVASIQRLDGNKFVTIYLAFVGVILIVASTYSVTGLTLEIQDGAGIAMIVVGLGLFVYISRRLKHLRAMVSETAAHAV
jgi:hydrogenase/urease accessory protein HupE